MKKIGFLLLLCVMLVSCKDDASKEWQQFNDFTLDDIKGTYRYSNVSDAFDALTENEYCHICEDADVNVRSYLGSDSSIEFKVSSQRATFNKTFTGRPVINEDTYLLKMSNPATAQYPDYELTAYVYKNAKGDVRLHGFARRVFYETVIENGMPVTKIKYTIGYYYDVIKN